MGPAGRAFGLVVDLPESARYVERQHLAKWGISEDAAFAAAHANLAGTSEGRG